jgi:hypothetical protein
MRYIPIVLAAMCCAGMLTGVITEIVHIVKSFFKKEV